MRPGVRAAEPRGGPVPRAARQLRARAPDQQVRALLRRRRRRQREVCGLYIYVFIIQIIFNKIICNVNEMLLFFYLGFFIKE